MVAANAGELQERRRREERRRTERRCAQIPVLVDRRMPAERRAPVERRIAALSATLKQT